MLSLPWGYHDEIACRDYATGLKFHVYYCDEVTWFTGLGQLS